MRHSILLSIAFGTQVCLAQTAVLPQRINNWTHIAALPPGTPVLVHQPYQRFATACELAWIDNSALACDTTTLDGRPQRVIFPAAAVDSVRRDNAADPDHHSAGPMLVGMVIGGGLGAAIGARAGVGPAFALAGLGAGTGGAFATSAGTGFPGPPRPQFGVRIPLNARSTWRPVRR